MTTNKIKPDFAVLDGIRGIAAFYVVINHSRGHLLQGGSELAMIKPISDWTIIEKLYYSLLQFTAIGTEFVIIFFVLSGFSIAYSLRNRQKIGGFYLKRLIRLYPPYVLGLFLAFITFLIINMYSPMLNSNGVSVFHDWKTTMLNLIYINKGNFIPQFWSLIHEVFFYLLIPFALLKKRYYYVISIILYIVGLFISETSINTNPLWMFFLKYNIYFVIGVYLFNNYKVLEKYLLIKNNSLFYIVLSALFVSAVVIKFLSDGYSSITFLIAAVASVLLIVNFLDKKTTNKLLRWLGQMSYTLYVTHFASIYLFYLIYVKVGGGESNWKNYDMVGMDCRNTICASDFTYNILTR